MISLPVRVDSSLTKLESGKAAVRNPKLERRISRLERTNRKLIGAVIFTALFSGGLQLILGDAIIPGAILLTIAAITLGWVLFSG